MHVQENGVILMNNDEWIELYWASPEIHSAIHEHNKKILDQP